MRLTTTAVIANHLLASLAPTTAQSRTMHSEYMLRAWATLGAVIAVSAVFGGGPRRWVHLAAHVTMLSALAVINTAVHVFMCDSMAYCFLLHASAALASDIVSDKLAGHGLRVAMTLAFAASLAAAHLAPFPLPVGSAAFFVHSPEPIPFSCYTFEAAHLWAAALVCVAHTVCQAGVRAIS